MGWSIYVKLDKPIAREALGALLQEMGSDMQGCLGSTEQSWGWSMAVDVHFPRDAAELAEVGLGGSFTQSGHLAEGFCRELCCLLREAGYAPAPGEMSG